MKPTIVLIGGIFILLGILAGAFGTHILENHLSIQQLTSLQTGVHYQIYHGLALIIIGFNIIKLKKAKNHLLGMDRWDSTFFRFHIFFSLR